MIWYTNSKVISPQTAKSCNAGEFSHGLQINMDFFQEMFYKDDKTLVLAKAALIREGRRFTNACTIIDVKPPQSDEPINYC